MIVCKYEYYSHFFSVEALCFTKKSYKKGCDNHRFYFKTNYHIIRIIKTIRRIYYGEERTLWTQNSARSL